MKKVFALILALAMVLCSVAMAETATAVTGSWYASMAGIVIQLDLNEDGTFAMSLMGETNTGAWELEGDTLYMERGTEAEVACAVTADSLTAASGEMELVFTREPIEEFVAPEKVTVDDVAAFNGTWNGTMVSAFGMTFDMDAAQAELGAMLGLEDTKVVIDNGSVSMFGQEAEAFEFADGHLKLAAGSEEMDLSVTVDMNADGTIVLEMMTIQFFCEKVVAE